MSNNNNLMTTQTDVWSNGAFHLHRKRLTVPITETDTKIITQRLLACAGSRDGVSQRVVAFERFAFFVPLDTTTEAWGNSQTSHTEYWATINNNVTAIQTFNTGSVLGGYGCTCTDHPASFSQWLTSLSVNSGNQFGMDNLAHAPPLELPANWFAPNGAASVANSNTTHYVYTGEPVYDFGSSWMLTNVMKEGGVLTRHEPDSANRAYSFIPPSDTTKPLTLRIWSDGPQPYKFRIDMVQKDHGGSKEPIAETQMNPQDVYTHKVDSILLSNNGNNEDHKLHRQATAYILNPLPSEGYYYSITILNDEEQETILEDDTTNNPYPICRPNLYYSKTKFGLKLSLQSCDDLACDGETIQIGNPSGSSSAAGAATTTINGWITMLTMLVCLVSHLFHKR